MQVSNLTLHKVTRKPFYTIVQNVMISWHLIFCVRFSQRRIALAIHFMRKVRHVLCIHDNNMLWSFLQMCDDPGLVAVRPPEDKTILSVASISRAMCFGLFCNISLTSSTVHMVRANFTLFPRVCVWFGSYIIYEA